MRLLSTQGRICLLIGCLLLATPIEARCDPASEPFEVIVMRGAGVSRVTGTGSGEIHEEVILEAPPPAEPPPEPARTSSVREPDDDEPQQTVVVYVVPGNTTVSRVFLGNSHHRPGHGLRWQDPKAHHGVWRPTGSSPRFQRTGLRGGHAGGHSGRRR